MALNRTKWKYLGIFILGFLMFSGITYMVAENLFIEGHIQVASLVMTIFFGFMALLCLFALLTFNRQFRKHQESSQKQPERGSYKWLKVSGLLFFSAFIAWLNFLAIDGFVSGPELDMEDMTSVTGTLSEDMEYRDPAKGSATLYFKTKEHPKLTFNIGFARQHSSIANYLGQDSIVEFIIPIDDHDIWISETRAKGFWDKHESFGWVQVYGLRSSKYIFFDVDKYNKLEEEDNAIGIVIMAILDLIILIIGMCYWIRKSNR